MQQNLANLLANITNAKPLLPVYLMHADSDNAALVNYAIMQLKSNIKDVNMHNFQVDRYFDFKVIKELLSSGNLFTDSTYIELNYKNKPTVSHQEELISILNAIPENTYIVITTDKLTRSELNSKWVGAASRVGMVIAITENDGGVIVKDMLRIRGLKISSLAFTLLLQQNIGNPTGLLQETEKLTFLYQAGHTISDMDIMAQNIDNAQYNIYQLSTSYLQADLVHALSILDNIFMNVEDAILIMWIINEDVRKLLQLKAKMREQSFAVAVKELNIWGSNVSALGAAAERISYTTLVTIFDELATLDCMIKGVIKDIDIKIQLTKIIRNLCA